MTVFIEPLLIRPSPSAAPALITPETAATSRIDTLLNTVGLLSDGGAKVLHDRIVTMLQLTAETRVQLADLDECLAEWLAVDPNGATDDFEAISLSSERSMWQERLEVAAQTMRPTLDALRRVLA